MSSEPDSLQLRVLCFGLLQDGDVGVGVFPEGEEPLLRQAHAFEQVNVARIGAERISGSADAIPRVSGI